MWMAATSSVLFFLFFKSHRGPPHSLLDPPHSLPDRSGLPSIYLMLDGGKVA